MKTETPVPAPFAKAFWQLAGSMRGHVEPGTAALYYESLNDFAIEVLIASADELQREATFFPSVAEWRTAAQRVQHALITATPGESPIYAYDSTETFTEAELERAREIRAMGGVRRVGARVDACPHTPACPNVRVCVEEIAWYVRHRAELDAE